jgi:hypothetical protein
MRNPTLPKPEIFTISSRHFILKADGGDNDVHRLRPVRISKYVIYVRAKVVEVFRFVQIGMIWR